jgi:ferric-dicitrate binding protein FerR (iron transport regulator)
MAGSQEQEGLDQAALAWVIALHDAPNDPQVRSALQGWLAASPEHRAAYGEARKVWELTGLALAPQPDGDEPQAPAADPSALPGVRDA